MKTALFVCFVLIASNNYAQDTTNTANSNADSFTTVQVEAKFPGGQQAWFKFLVEHIHSDVASKHNAPVGNYTVAVSFLVDATGKVSEVSVLKDPGYGTAADVLKVFKNMPAWIPAIQNGKAVTYRQKQNITYQVTKD